VQSFEAKVVLCHSQTLIKSRVHQILDLVADINFEVLTGFPILTAIPTPIQYFNLFLLHIVQLTCHLTEKVSLANRAVELKQIEVLISDQQPRKNVLVMGAIE